MKPATAHRLNQPDVQQRDLSLLYVLFDGLPAHCREALRQDGHWTLSELISCDRHHMPCDTRLRRGQTISDRKTEVQKAVERLNRGLTSGSIKALVSKQGGVVFEGFSDLERDGVTDACALRRILATGSSSAKLAIQKAEQRAGRTLDKTAIAQGLHSHDGGATWHHHKG